MPRPVRGSWQARWERLRWRTSCWCRAVDRSAAWVSAMRATVLRRRTSRTARSTVRAVTTMPLWGWGVRSAWMSSWPRTETSGLSNASARSIVPRTRPPAADGLRRTKATLGWSMAEPTRTDHASQQAVEMAPYSWSEAWFSR
ncbi:hypothetical protein GCM10018955_60470 [Planomonospora venezuelensis]